MTAAPVLREVPADRPPPRPIRKEVRDALERGGVVALGTETVYGLAIRPDAPGALERLRALKGRDERAFTWHVASLDPLEHFPHLENLVRRVAERYWPGPLTLVLRGEAPGLEAIALDGWTGLRLPAHTSTRAVLDFVRAPVVMTSANRQGEPPLTDAAEIERAFEGPLELILDSGAPSLGESSTVLRIGPATLEILREGLISIADVRRTIGRRTALVCTGNTCRSPMAEGIAKRVLLEHLGFEDLPSDPDRALAHFGFEFVSRGVYASVGAPPSEHAVTVLAKQGIDISRHASRPVVPEEVADFDHVYCMTHSHESALKQALPPRAAKHVELLDPDGMDVPDPIGSPLAEYEHCAQSIRSALERRLANWV